MRLPGYYSLLIILMLLRGLSGLAVGGTPGPELAANNYFDVAPLQIPINLIPSGSGVPPTALDSSGSGVPPTALNSSGSGVPPTALSSSGSGVPPTAYVQTVETELAETFIDLPLRPDGTSASLKLQSHLPQGPHRWLIVNLANSAEQAGFFVITLSHDNFPGSRLFSAARQGSSVLSLASAGLNSVETLQARAQEAYGFILEGKARASLAFEIASNSHPTIMLMPYSSYLKSFENSALFSKTMLVLALALTLSLLALSAATARPLFFAAGLFALSATGFIALELGDLGLLSDLLSPADQSFTIDRAFIEACMAASLFLCFLTTSHIRTLGPTISYINPIFGTLVCLLPLYSFFDPIMSSALARILFVVTSAVALTLVTFFWWRSALEIRATLPFWAALSLWVLIAIISAFSIGPTSWIDPLLIPSLLFVLVILTYLMMRHAFRQGLLERRALREAKRYALAFVSTNNFLWDRSVKDDKLFIGRELSRYLGFPPSISANQGTEGFTQLLCNEDIDTYHAALRAAEKSKRRKFGHKLRLHCADGTLLWFQLTARILRNRQGEAIRMIGSLSGTKAPEPKAAGPSDNSLVYDRLTGLPNRLLLIDRLQRDLKRLKAFELNTLSLLLIDIDRFKELNNRLGTTNGDIILRSLSRRLEALAETTDTLARISGSQFSFIYSSPSLARNFEKFLEQLHKTIEQPLALPAHNLFLSATIGITHAHTNSAPEEMLHEASLALYTANNHGHGENIIFDPSMQDEHFALESELHYALEHSEIEIFYQPIMEIKTQNPIGFEALIRWRHKVRGLLTPDFFMPIAEEAGIKSELSAFVLNEATRQLGIWQRAYGAIGPIFVSVNISSDQLTRTNLVDDVERAIRREVIVPNSLKLELTEESLIDDPEHALATLQQLKKLGVSLACDDFGTGYSSLANLWKLPFDTLKLDKSFLSTDTQTQSAAIILSSIVNMARDLGLLLIIEGVETEKQLDTLKELGCDFAQGFLLGEPRTAQQISQWFTEIPYGYKNDQLIDFTQAENSEQPDLSTENQPAEDQATPEQPTERSSEVRSEAPNKTERSGETQNPTKVKKRSTKKKTARTNHAVKKEDNQA